MIGVRYEKIDLVNRQYEHILRHILNTNGQYYTAYLENIFQSNGTDILSILTNSSFNKLDR